MSATTSAPGPAGAAAPANVSADPDTPDDNVVCTITSDGQGGFTVYAGDEPEEGESGDMSGDDAAAMGPEGNQAAPQGQPADSVGAALKIVMQILQGASSGPSAAQDQFAEGFGGASAASPLPQKY